MRVLGIEGTAHTCGVGIVEDDPGDPETCRVLAHRADMLRPAQGGIHPREAADHHVAALPGLVAAVLADAGLRPSDLDGIAFSQGPGLGPCLRTVATAARALALAHELPLAGVNHCVAHLEIGRATTGARDPVMLYVSGANTQIIAEARGRYRVFGETLDIGIGNALDKFARAEGLPFPGGPAVERLAAEGERILAQEGAALPALPYSVKGMDVAYSGFVTAAEALVRGGAPLPVVAHAFQEWGFAMLVEVAERALAYTGKCELLLGGGVGRNLRLQMMLRTMVEARGVRLFAPAPDLLSDNGAMIAWNGLLALRAGGAIAVEDSAVDPRQRTDDVPLVWRPQAARGVVAPQETAVPGAPFAVGAEAEVRRATFLGRDVVLKTRVAKAYRHAAIERSLASLRVRHEARLLADARAAGVAAPAVLDADPGAGVLVLEEVPGATLAMMMSAGGAPPAPKLFVALGRGVAALHAAGLVHGDLTPANVMSANGDAPVLIDFGLGERTREPEAQAVDLHVLQESLSAAPDGADGLWEAFAKGYRDGAGGNADAVFASLSDIERRGRYRSASE